MVPLHQQNSSEINADSRKNVPLFSCVVYVSSTDGGQVRARVANFPGLQCVAANERQALATLIPAFKKQLVESMQDNTPIPWIDPPVDAEPQEQQRYIPVHL